MRWPAKFFNSFISCLTLSGLFLIIGLSVAAAAELPCSQDTVSHDKLTFDLLSGKIVDSTDREYILAGIYLFNDIPALDEKIKQALLAFFEQSDIEVHAASGGKDRYGRIAAQIVSTADNPQWLQKSLVENGLALARPGTVEAPCITALFAAESRAEAGRKGIWQNGRQIIMPSNDHNWAAKADNYLIVEGEVLSVGETGSRFYLNFGDDWQIDFTVTVAKRVAKRLLESTGNLKELAGKKIRVRGWMLSDRGPKIEVYYPGQIEIMGN